MAIVVTNEGELELLDKALKDALSTDESFSLRLFQNDYTPINTTTLTDFTEADFTSYARKTLTRAGWKAAALNASNEAEAEYSAEQSWTCGATGGDVYGYYVVGATSGKILWCERFEQSRSLLVGDELAFTPTFTLRSRREN